jgi:hypothetical protein
MQRFEAVNLWLRNDLLPVKVRRSTVAILAAFLVLGARYFQVRTQPVEPTSAPDSAVSVRWVRANVQEAEGAQGKPGGGLSVV